MYKALHLSPMIPSYNVRETLSFFTTVLGFGVVRDEGTYAIIDKNSCSIHILQAGEAIGEMEFYLEVDDIDNLWEQIKNRLEGIKVKPPFNRAYGMREIHIIIPHTKTLLFIGQVIAA